MIPKFRQKSPVTYIILTFFISWSFWLAAALVGYSLETPVGLALYIAGGLGPLLAAVILTMFGEDRQTQADFWARILQVRRIGWRWFPIILGLPALLTGVAVVIDRALGGTGAQLDRAADLIADPLTVVPFVLVTIIVGPLPEELGWRGYALDRLQRRADALLSSLILGIIWAVWHTPLFLIPNTYQSDLGFLTPRFWLFMLAILPLSVLFTWIYNNCGRSTLSAVLFHSAVNATGELLDLSQQADLILFILWLLAALVVLALFGRTSLTQRTGPAAA